MELALGIMVTMEISPVFRYCSLSATCRFSREIHKERRMTAF